MSKKTARSTILLVLGILLSACSALPAAASTTTPSSTSSASSIVSKLGVGLLQLEETSYAINASQAKDLLPLWKAVKSLGADRNASQVEVEALYAQIQETLSAEQVQFITGLNLSSSEISGLVQKYAQASASGNGGSQGPTAQATRTAGSGAASGPGGPGGDFGGGGPGGIPGVNMTGASGSTSSTQTTAQSIAQATAAARSANTISSTLNVQLANSIIQLLEKRANA